MITGRFILFTLIWALVFTPLSGQDDITVLLKKFSHEKNDSSNVNLAIDISNAYIFTNTEKAIYYAQMADSLAIDGKYPVGEFKAKSLLGAIYGFDLAKPIEGVVLLDKAISISKFFNIPKTELIKPYINKASILYQSSSYGTAIEAFIAADNIAIKESMPEARAKILNNLSLVYRTLKRYEEAAQILKESINIRTQLNDKKGLANNHFNLASTYSKMNKFDDALNEVDIAKAFYVELEDSKQVIDCDFSKATIYIDKATLSKNKESFRKGYDILSKISKKKQELSFSELNQLTFCVYYANASFELGKDNEALAILENFKMNNSRDKFLPQAKEYFKQKSIIYDKLGNFELALFNLKKMNEIVNEMAVKDNMTFRNEMETKFLTIEKQRNIEVLEIKNELTSSKLKTSNIILGLLALIAIILGLFLWFYYRLFVKFKKQNAYIEKANVEKTFLLKEIHHRVKNNLQVISSLLGLQSRYVDDKVALEALKTGKLRVQTMSLLHQRLYNNEDLKSINIKTYFTDLGENIFDSYKIDKNNIEFVMDIDDVDLDVDIVVPMGLIVNELMTNSLKYAFKNKENGTMNLAIKQNKSSIEILYHDDGVGYPFERLPKESKSMGLNLIKSFTEKLTGVIAIDNSNGASTKIKFNLPGLTFIRA